LHEHLLFQSKWKEGYGDLLKSLLVPTKSRLDCLQMQRRHRDILQEHKVHKRLFQGEKKQNRNKIVIGRKYKRTNLVPHLKNKRPIWKDLLGLV